VPACDNFSTSMPFGSRGEYMSCSTRLLGCMLVSVQSPTVLQCPEGAPAAVACDAGTFTAATNLVSVDQCEPCPVGFACSAGTSTPEPCAAGRYGATQGQTSRECTGACIPGHYCLKGSTTNSSGVCGECHQTQKQVAHNPCPLRAPMLLHCSCGAVQQRTWQHVSISLRTEPERHVHIVTRSM
jgi:hypothetical protein